MDKNSISFHGSDTLYEPKEINQKIINEESDSDWYFYRDILNDLLNKKLITSKQRYMCLIQIRKELGFFIIK